MEDKKVKEIYSLNGIKASNFKAGGSNAIHIMNTIKQLLSLWKQSAKMDLSWFLRDTKYCLLNITADLIAIFSAVFGVFLLSERFGGIGGMNNKQILFMLGYATIIDGFFNLFFSMCNIGHISRVIGRGQLDHKLIQPLPFWMQFATDGFIPISGSSTLLCGIGITIYAILSLGIHVSFIWLVLLSVSLLSSIIIIIAVSYIIGSAAFYSPVSAEEVSTTVINLFDSIKGYPLGGLSQSAKVIFCTIIPVGLTAWFPANVLLGITSTGLSALFTIIAAILLSTIATIFFKKGMKYYAKFGSIRYLDRGHRR